MGFLIRRTFEEKDQVRKMLFPDPEKSGRLPVGAERDDLHKEYNRLRDRAHQLTAALGRRTYKRDHGTWARPRVVARGVVDLVD